MAATHGPKPTVAPDTFPTVQPERGIQTVKCCGSVNVSTEKVWLTTEAAHVPPVEVAADTLTVIPTEFIGVIWEKTNAAWPLLPTADQVIDVGAWFDAYSS